MAAGKASQPAVPFKINSPRHVIVMWNGKHGALRVLVSSMLSYASAFVIQVTSYTPQFGQSKAETISLKGQFVLIHIKIYELY